MHGILTTETLIGIYLLFACLVVNALQGMLAGQAANPEDRETETLCALWGCG